jgi:hypothetical protein
MNELDEKVKQLLLSLVEKGITSGFQEEKREYISLLCFGICVLPTVLFLWKIVLHGRF